MKTAMKSRTIQSGTASIVVGIGMLLGNGGGEAAGPVSIDQLDQPPVQETHSTEDTLLGLGAIASGVGAINGRYRVKGNDRIGKKGETDEE